MFIDTDSYKFSHYKQFPPGTTWTQSHFIARSGTDTKIVFCGLQPVLSNLQFVPGKAEVTEMGKWIEAHGVPFNYKGWLKIARLGYYPIKVNALPEGTIVDIGTPCFTVESTDPELFWVPQYLETQLLRCWHMINVATISYRCRNVIYEFLQESSDNPDSEILFKLHDFGSRGCSSLESAAIGGVGHLLSFRGTDTVAALYAAKSHYKCEMAGFSIPASEHSTMCGWGEEREKESIHNLLDQFPDGLVSCVLDSFNLKRAVQSLGDADIKQKLGNRKGTLVVRPDSGDPLEESLKTIQLLAREFGAKTNSKGFSVLPDYVRVIYGDGVNPDTIALILNKLQNRGFSASNIAFGMGGALLQQHNRDTHGIAYKLNAIEIDGKRIGVCKKSPGKESHAGEINDPEMNVVYDNGAHKKESLDTIRRRLWPEGKVP